MAEVKWIKLTTTMFDDEKIRLVESMPEKDTILIIWIKLLVLAGKCNNNGYIYLSENIPYNDEMLSTLFNRPLNSVRMALETFKKFGMLEIDDRQVIFISNWEKHQNIEGMEKIKEQNRLRKQKQREKEVKLIQAAREETCGDGISHVTSRDSHATEREREEERDIDKERDSLSLYNGAMEVCNYYQAVYINRSIIAKYQQVANYVQMYSKEWVKDAIDIAYSKGKHDLDYIYGILKNWSIEGREEKTKKKESKQTTEERANAGAYKVI